MDGPESVTGEQPEKPVAEFWYGIQPQGDEIIRFSEINVDPHVVGDIWLLRGSERDLAVDSGSGIVPPAPVIEAVSGKSVCAVALNCYYDHAGGWHSFAERACHSLEAPALIDPSEESSLVSDYLTDATLWALAVLGGDTPGHGVKEQDVVMGRVFPNIGGEVFKVLDITYGVGNGIEEGAKGGYIEGVTTGDDSDGCFVCVQPVV